MSAVTIYSFDKSIDFSQILYHNAAVINISDKIVKTIDGYQESIGARGHNLNVSNTFSGNFQSVKNIHFVKGTHFDRDFFRRMYPNINVRNKPELADLIVYDKRSLFSNDNRPERFYKTKVGFGSILFDPKDLSAIKMIYAFMNGLNHSYKGLINIDHNNLSIVSNIVKAYMGGHYDHVTCHKNNDYFDQLDKAGKPYLHVDKIISSLESTQRSNTLTLQELLVLFDQIKSRNYQVVKTAAETLIMFESKKYLPLQILLLQFDGENAAKSEKVRLFSNSYNFVVGGYSSSVPRSFFSFYEYINQSIITKITPDTDTKLMADFLSSSDLINHLLSSEMAKAHCPLKSLDISFTFKDPRLSPIPTAPPVVASNNVDISEFAL